MAAIVAIVVEQVNNSKWCKTRFSHHLCTPFSQFIACNQLLLLKMSSSLHL